MEAYWYEIQRGIHSEGRLTYAPDLHDATGKATPYKAGKYIYTHRNLLKLNAPEGHGPERFRRLFQSEADELKLVPPEHAVKAAEEAEEKPDPRNPRWILEQLSVNRLKDTATVEGVDLQGATKKADIIDQIIITRDAYAGKGLENEEELEPVESPTD